MNTGATDGAVAVRLVMNKSANQAMLSFSRFRYPFCDSDIEANSSSASDESVAIHNTTCTAVVSVYYPYQNHYSLLPRGEIVLSTVYSSALSVTLTISKTKLPTRLGQIML